MGLREYEPESHKIEFRSGAKDYEFTVRGLCTEDISHLISQHLGDLQAGIALLEEARSATISTTAADAFILTLCREAPRLVAEVISLAADEPDLIEKYAKVPFSVQASALAEITRMTFESAGGLKNLSATTTNLIIQVLPPGARETLRSHYPELFSKDTTGA